MAQSQGGTSNHTDPEHGKETKKHQAENTFDFNLRVKIEKHATQLIIFSWLWVMRHIL